MPRDLFPPPVDEHFLTASPEPQEALSDDDEQDLHMQLSRGQIPPAYARAIFGGGDPDDRDQDRSNSARRNDDLHPLVQNLSISDLDACIALENAAFPPNERCSREKFVYRLTACPTLCIGLFSSTAQEPTPQVQGAYDAARAPDSFSPSNKSILIGHVIATMTAADRVTDASMEIPKDTSVRPSAGDKDAAGHNELGRTVVIHSVCILPTFQQTGLGKMILRAYLQRLEGSGIADSAALLAHPELVPWYTDNFGFGDQGESKVQFGGGGWHDLTYSFDDGMWS